MNILYFLLLSQEEQVRVVSKTGVKVSELVCGGCRFYLFDIDGFYVELLYDFANFKKPAITVSRVFDNTEYLKLYLRKIDVTVLTDILK